MDQVESRFGLHCLLPKLALQKSLLLYRDTYPQQIFCLYILLFFVGLEYIFKFPLLFWVSLHQCLSLKKTQHQIVYQYLYAVRGIESIYPHSKLMAIHHAFKNNRLLLEEIPFL